MKAFVKEQRWTANDAVRRVGANRRGAAPFAGSAAHALWPVDPTSARRLACHLGGFVPGSAHSSLAMARKIGFDNAVRSRREASR